MFICKQNDIYNNTMKSMDTVPFLLKLTSWYDIFP